MNIILFILYIHILKREGLMRQEKLFGLESMNVTKQLMKWNIFNSFGSNLRNKRELMRTEEKAQMMLIINRKETSINIFLNIA